MFKCEKCNREFNKKESLTRHINQTHNKTTPVVTKRKCPKCEKLVGANFYKRHLKQCDFSDKQIYILSESIKNENVLFVENLLEHIYDINKHTDTWKYIAAYKTFCNIINYVRNVNESDIDRFFESDILEWKKKNGAVANSKELCDIVFFDSKDEANQAYSVMKSKNAYTGHGSELSPFSKDFIGYKELEDKEEAVKQLVAKAEDGKEYCTRIEYWTKRGFTEEEAKQKIYERQNTNSVESIMKQRNCSKEEAIKIRQDITEKWLKSFPKSNYSKISQEIFWKLYKLISFNNVFFGSNDNGKRNDKKNKEFRVKTAKTFRLLDFYIPELGKAIEFDGDYWHGESRGNISRDQERTDEILEAMPNLKIFRIKEYDYKKDPDRIIKECIEWINE